MHCGVNRFTTTGAKIIFHSLIYFFFFSPLQSNGQKLERNVRSLSCNGWDLDVLMADSIFFFFFPSPFHQQHNLVVSNGMEVLTTLATSGVAEWAQFTQPIQLFCSCFSLWNPTYTYLSPS